jgi:hypothetical protein
MNEVDLPNGSLKNDFIDVLVKKQNSMRYFQVLPPTIFCIAVGYEVLSSSQPGRGILVFLPVLWLTVMWLIFGGNDRKEAGEIFDALTPSTREAFLEITKDPIRFRGFQERMDLFPESVKIPFQLMKARSLRRRLLIAFAILIPTFIASAFVRF